MSGAPVPGADLDSELLEGSAVLSTESDHLLIQDGQDEGPGQDEEVCVGLRAPLSKLTSKLPCVLATEGIS